MHTTFKELRSWDACESGYKALARHLGGIRKYGDTKPIPLSIGLELSTDAVENTLWVVSKMELTPYQERDFRLFACGCAERVLPIYEKHYPDDDRIKNCIEVAKRYANGKAGEEERDAAGDAAWAAARAAAGAAAWDAARAAAGAAAWAAAGAAAGDAAWAAARAAAWDAAGAAAWDAERKEQEKMLLKILKRYES